MITGAEQNWDLGVFDNHTKISKRKTTIVEKLPEKRNQKNNSLKFSSFFEKFDSKKALKYSN